MNSIDFKTKTTMNEESNPFISGFWSIAVDIGYSSVKCMSPNKSFSFPSFVRECDEENSEIIKGSSTTVRYRNKFGKTYDVGGTALTLANSREVNDNISTMYGRDWYDTNTYQVCLECALGIAMLSNKKREYKNEVLKVVTGLPCKYYGDSELLKSMITGHHSFDLIPPNSQKWVHMELDIADTIVITQPLGAIWSAGHDNSGKETADFQSIFKSNTVVFDGGFGTLDLFGVINETIAVRSTYRECGMKEVYLRTVKEIKDRFKADIPIPLLYRHLDEGVIYYYEPRSNNISIRYNNPDTYIRKSADFSEILSRKSMEVAEKALTLLLKDTNQLSTYNSVILSGGSAAAWSEYLINAISALGVDVIMASRNNPSTDPIFGNVRGYYMFLYHIIKEESREKH